MKKTINIKPVLSTQNRSKGISNSNTGPKCCFHLGTVIFVKKKPNTPKSRIGLNFIISIPFLIFCVKGSKVFCNSNGWLTCHLKLLPPYPGSWYYLPAPDSHSLSPDTLIRASPSEMEDPQVWPQDMNSRDCTSESLNTGRGGQNTSG